MLPALVADQNNPESHGRAAEWVKGSRTADTPLGAILPARRRIDRPESASHENRLSAALLLPGTCGQFIALQ
jgi:hypothetical protein